MFEKIRKLLGSRAVEILFALEGGPLCFRELAQRVGGSNTTIVMRLRDLEELALIKREKTARFPFKHSISLTEKGRKLVPLLKRIIRILEDT